MRGQQTGGQSGEQGQVEFSSGRADLRLPAGHLRGGAGWAVISARVAFGAGLGGWSQSDRPAGEGGENVRLPSLSIVCCSFPTPHPPTPAMSLVDSGRGRW